jgi:hypothetical protein
MKTFLVEDNHYLYQAMFTMANIAGLSEMKLVTENQSSMSRGFCCISK